MEEKERELLDRLKITSKSVEDQENKVRSLQGAGKKSKPKHAQSIVKKYISSPIHNEIIHEVDSSTFTTISKPNIKVKKASQNHSGKPNDSMPVVPQQEETGQERSEN